MKKTAGSRMCIEPKTPFTETDLNWIDKQSHNSVEMNDPTSRSEIARRRDTMDNFDVIFVVFPIWWYVVPQIINTFLESYDFTGKTIVGFAASGGGWVSKTVKLQASCSEAKLVEGKVLKPDATAAELSI